MTADCVPIILFDVNNQIIGCIHAGWKGAISGIIENTIKKFKKLSSHNKIYAVIKDTFINQDGHNESLTMPNPLQQQSLLKRAYSKINKNEVVRKLLNILVTDLIENSQNKINLANIKHIDDVYKKKINIINFSNNVNISLNEIRNFLKKCG